MKLPKFRPRRREIDDHEFKETVVAPHMLAGLDENSKTLLMTNLSVNQKFDWVVSILKEHDNSIYQMETFLMEILDELEQNDAVREEDMTAVKNFITELRTTTQSTVKTLDTLKGRDECFCVQNKEDFDNFVKNEFAEIKQAFTLVKSGKALAVAGFLCVSALLGTVNAALSVKGHFSAKAKANTTQIEKPGK